MAAADPFAVIETETPSFGETEVRQIVRAHYGLNVSLDPLLSERDQNFHMRCADGREFVLKIANAAEDPQATEFQVAALQHLEAYLAANESPVIVPRIVKTLSGESSITVESGSSQHVTRVITYLPGVPLGRTSPSDELCRDLGIHLAHLGRALRDFEHPGSGHGLLWDIQQALQLRRILDHVDDRKMRATVAATLDDFESCALPGLGSLRTQVIHSDLNPENVLIDTDDGSRVAGIIDFGDMLKAPLIVDVAVACSYLRTLDGNPLARIAEFLSAYHSVTPLELEEIDLLFDLIKTRLAATISILAWRASLRGADDAYLREAVASENSAADFLERIQELPRDHARQTFRQVCASQAAS
ncbi:MAG: phosphotransferase [Woeseiaceae bacterium]|nr:phosphotransferase [Woeseiaceae bacterium]